MVSKIITHGKVLFERRQSSILSAAAVITGAGLLSMLLGLLKSRIFIHYFSKEQYDAFLVASRLPETVFQLLVVGALSASFIPVFSKYLEKDKKEAYEISSSMITIVLGSLLILSLIIFIFAYPFTAQITGPNFGAEQIKLAVQLTRIMLFAQIFFALSNFITGIIHSHHRFLIPALAPLAYNIGIILGVVFLKDYIGIYSAAAGVVLGSLLHLLMQIPLARTLGFVYHPNLLFKHRGVKEMLRLMPPRTLAISVNQLELFAAVYFATALSSGSLVIFNLAQQLMSAPVRIISVPISQASLPFLSKEVSSGKFDQFKLTLLNSLNQIFYLSLPASALLLVLRIPLVRIIYGAPRFPWSSTVLTGRVLSILSLSIFAQTAIPLLVRAFYALHNTKIPFYIALFSVSLNISFAYFFTFILKLGLPGLAISMTLATFIQFGLLLWGLQKKVGNLVDQALLTPLLKMMTATIIMGLFLWINMRFFDQYVFNTTKTIPLITLTIVVSSLGMIIYLFLSKLFKITELDAYLRLIKKAGNWRQVLINSDEVLESSGSTGEIKPT